MSEFQQHMRNVMRQDQVEAMYRDWLNKMDDSRLVNLCAAAVEWMGTHAPKENREGTLAVPADVAHEAVACLVLRLSGELTQRLHRADGSVE